MPENSSGANTIRGIRFGQCRRVIRIQYEKKVPVSESSKI